MSSDDDSGDAYDSEHVVVPNEGLLPGRREISHPDDQSRSVDGK